MTKAADTNDETLGLANFDDDEEENKATQNGAEPKAKTTTGGVYVGVRISGFRDFLLKAELNRAIQEAGFEHPSEVQHQCIPPACLGQDVLCQAKSGMGKTAVFVLALLQQIEVTDEKFVQGLVLTHTRELAYQISNEFTRFAQYMDGVKTAVFYGGRKKELDMQVLDKKGDQFPALVVATPGRCLFLQRTGHLDTSKLKYFILDECDKMLEVLDMRQDVQQIFVKTPKQKQVLMFSATMPHEVRKTAKLFMQKPVEVYVDSEAKLTLHGLQQYFVECTEAEKNKKLIDLLDTLEFNQVMIFAKTVNRASQLTKLLRDAKFPAAVMHSRIQQEERIATYTRFKECKTRMLVSTDICGRGIDIERVNIVINYDMTEDDAKQNQKASDSYLHRVGRAGRFGTKGLAITFISSPSDKASLDSVQERFAVQVKKMPDTIDTSSYMQS
eukprot:252589_1